MLRRSVFFFRWRQNLLVDQSLGQEPEANLQNL